MNKTAYLIGIITLTALYGCETIPSVAPAGPRTVVLGGTSYSESALGKFITWRCSDYVSRDKVLVEAGTFENTELSAAGFILYDGGDAGDATNYERKGLIHRWDWGPKGNDYAFIIKPDGTGVYYDFSSVPKGESTKANSIFKCHRT